MKIPSDAVGRAQFYREIADQCFRDRHTRVGQYNRNLQYYLYGTADATSLPTLNKLGPHIELVSAYLYTEETVRFTIELGQSAPDSELDKVDPLVSDLEDEWNDCGLDALFADAVTWGLVWDSTFIKLRWKNGGCVPYLVAPHDIGLYRPDVTHLDRQEAIAHRYLISRTELQWQLESSQHPSKAAILKAVTAGSVSVESQYPQVVRDIMLSNMPANITGTMSGVVDMGMAAAIDNYTPILPPDMLVLVELWIQDDDLPSRWRVVTQTEEQSVTIYDRPAYDPKQSKNVFIPGEQPFRQVRPRPMIGYAWGASEVTRLIPLQEAISKRVEDIRHLLSKQVRPSYAGIGLAGDEATIRTALDSESGWIPFPDAGSGKIENLAPKMPEDVFKEVQVLEGYFEEASGISGLMRGRGEPGVRSRGQTDKLAQMGATRIKRRAMITEDSLDDVSTLVLKMKQFYDDRKLHYFDSKTGTMIPFIAAQFTKDFTCKVDSHSMSPVFAEDNKQLAFDLHERNVITRERLVDMLKPMQRQKIKRELKAIEAKEDAARKEELAAKSGQAQQGAPPLRQVK